MGVYPNTFTTPVLLLDTPSTSAFTTQASYMALAGQDTSLISQGDVHQAAAHTYASISGGTTSLFTHSGGIKAYAANGTVSLRAHTDELQIWADKDVTIISVNNEIRIQAKSKIELIGGQASLTLEGGNITFACPGKFEVKSSTHAFLGGGSGAPEITRLPDSRVKLFDEAFVLKSQETGQPMPFVRYTIKRADGSVESGISDEKGQTHLVSSAEAENISIVVEA